MSSRSEILSDPKPPRQALPTAFETINEDISGVVLRPGFGRGWLAGSVITASGSIVLLIAAGTLLFAGVGVWGVNDPTSWGIAITNLVWWIGIAHAGSVLSASLLLLRQRWRHSMARFAESMTVFAIICAGLFPLLHMGRPYYFYWLLPYPNEIGVEPQFRSPLVWEVFAVFAYTALSILFWYLGMVPDLATMRDRAASRWIGRCYAIAALGWRGNATQWKHYQTALRLLAGLTVVLVVVHSVGALNFAATVVSGWHSTIYPPHFIAGAMQSGFAMILVLGIPLRWRYRLETYITERHLQNLSKLMIAASLVTGYCVFMQGYSQWQVGEEHGWYAAIVLLQGGRMRMHWITLACLLGVPLLLTIRVVRRSPLVLWFASLAVLVGMWLERYLIVVGHLEHGRMLSARAAYQPTIWDWGLLLGTFGLFGLFFLLFLRFIPVASMFGLRNELYDQRRASERATAAPSHPEGAAS